MKKTLYFTLAILLGILLLLSGLFVYSRSWEHALFVKPLNKLDTQEKVVALTFDDGPSTMRTPPLLDLLRAKEVKATFFMLGQNIERHPEIAQRVFEEGHLIGNHSFDHPRLMLKSPAFVKAQIQRTEELIRGLGQQEVQYVRPPYCYKYIVLPWVLKSMNKRLVTGTYDPPSEYKTPYVAQTVADEVMSNAGPGTIVFLHDGKNADRDAFVKSVELIIDGLRERGYRFVLINEAGI